MPVRPKPTLYNIPGIQVLSEPDLQGLLQEVLARNVPIRFRARGQSMFPFVRDGDMVTVSPKTGLVPRCGDIVAFCHPASGRLLVHRVISAVSGEYLVQGDNIAEPDGLVSPERILGLITRVERNGRRVSLGLGPERRLIASFAKYRLLRSLVYHAARIFRPLLQRSQA